MRSFIKSYQTKFYHIERYERLSTKFNKVTEMRIFLDFVFCVSRTKVFQEEESFPISLLAINKESKNNQEREIENA